jgi:hypothetical protein
MCMCGAASYLDGMELGDEKSPMQLTVVQPADKQRSAFGWEWTEGLRDAEKEHSNAAWLERGGPQRVVSAARYWDVVPDVRSGLFFD